MCYDLYNQYLFSETMVALGNERQKAASGEAHQLDLVTKKLKNLQWRTKKSTKALVIFIIMIPTVAVALFALFVYKREVITNFDRFGCTAVEDNLVMVCK